MRWLFQFRMLPRTCTLRCCRLQRSRPRGGTRGPRRGGRPHLLHRPRLLTHLTDTITEYQHVRSTQSTQATWAHSNHVLRRPQKMTTNDKMEADLRAAAMHGDEAALTALLDAKIVDIDGVDSWVRGAVRPRGLPRPPRRRGGQARPAGHERIDGRDVRGGQGQRGLPQPPRRRGGQVRPAGHGGGHGRDVRGGQGPRGLRCAPRSSRLPIDESHASVDRKRPLHRTRFSVPRRESRGSYRFTRSLNQESGTAGFDKFRWWSGI